MGSTGEVRSRAWICGFSSTAKTAAFARSASPCAVFRRFAQFSSVRRSASDSTSGSSLVSPMPPADRGPTASSPPSRDLKQNTTHVVMRKPKTGTLADLERCLADANWGAVMADHGADRLAARITALEEVLATPWPLRLLAAWRLG